MSPIRSPFPISDRKEPLITAVIAFLEQVLHIEKSAILDISMETTTFESQLLRRVISDLQEYAVTVRISPPNEHLGDKIYLILKYQAGEYLISKLMFQPGWKPGEEQEG